MKPYLKCKYCGMYHSVEERVCANPDCRNPLDVGPVLLLSGELPVTVGVYPPGPYEKDYIEVITCPNCGSDILPGAAGEITCPCCDRTIPSNAVRTIRELNQRQPAQRQDGFTVLDEVFAEKNFTNVPVLEMRSTKFPDKYVCYILPKDSPVTLGLQAIMAEFLATGIGCSRKHCTLSIRDGMWYLKDHSLNGTRINGDLYKNTCEQIPITDGTRIQFGGLPEAAEIIVRYVQNYNLYNLHIEVKDGTGMTYDFSPADSPVTVGRDYAMQHSLRRDMRSSRSHCDFIFRDNSWWIRDHSTHGSVINGEPIKHNTAAKEITSPSSIIFSDREDGVTVVATVIQM